MKVKPSGLTRRDFIRTVGLYGGSALTAMSALGLVSESSGRGPDVESLNPVSGERRARVIILGAGVAGMTAAYELRKLGFECIILEPRQRSGGRCWTIRKGVRETDTDGVEQVCNYAPGQYYNPGPMRIPQWHVTLDYCKQFGVPIEPFANANEAAYYYFSGSKRVRGLAAVVGGGSELDYGGPLMGERLRIREAKADLRGQMSELFAKAIDQDALDHSFSEVDKERVIEYLRSEGDLNPDLVYRGSTRRGFKEWPGVGNRPGVLDEIYSMQNLIQGGFGNFFNSENEYYWQMMMYQPTGGMDQIAKAFEQRVGDAIHYGAEVTEIRKQANGVKITYQEDGWPREISGDFTVCTIPFEILKDIPNDFSKAKQEAFRELPWMNLGKTGMQFDRRFWEDDDRIFGGISHTDLPISQIGYPSFDYLGEKGVLIGYFVSGATADYWGGMTPAERTEEALKYGAMIHPQYREHFENAFSVDWKKIKHSKGCTLHWTQDLRDRYYREITTGDDRMFLAGDFTTYNAGWIAGAIESGREVTKKIHEYVSVA